MRYKDFPVTIDELVTEGHLSMRRSTYEALTGEKLEEPALLHRKTGDLSARLSRFGAATAAVTVVPEGTMQMPDGTLTEPDTAHEITAVPEPIYDTDPDPEAGARMAKGQYFGDFDGHTQTWFNKDGTLADPPPEETAVPETPQHEWLRKEAEAKEHPAA